MYKEDIEFHQLTAAVLALERDDGGDGGDRVCCTDGEETRKDKTAPRPSSALALIRFRSGQEYGGRSRPADPLAPALRVSAFVRSFLFSFFFSLYGSTFGKGSSEVNHHHHYHHVLFFRLFFPRKFPLTLQWAEGPLA